MKCQARTARRKPCKAPPLKGGKYCFTHEPTNAATAAAARKLGGYNRATPHAGNPASIPAEIASIQDAGQILNYTLLELIVMDNSIPRARALLALFDSYIKSIEQTEIIKRIEALEGKT